MAGRRYEMKGRCSLEAWSGWHLTAQRAGVSVAALVQALGEAMAADPETISMAAVAARARQVSEQRYERE